MEFTHSGAVGRPAVTASKDELPETIVSGLFDSAYAAARHVPGKNLIFGSAYPIVQEEIAKVGGSPILVQYDPPLCLGMQGTADYWNDVDHAGTYAAGGFGSSGILATVREQLHHRFRGAATPSLLPDTIEPERLFGYAYTFRHLPYDEREGIFARVAVGPGPKDFVLDLPLKVPEDRLLVASIPPGETLAATFARAANANFAVSRTFAAWALEERQMPLIHFDITWKFRTIAARYNFRLDERGATLLSESAQTALPLPPILVARAGGPAPMPILVAMMRRGARRPYFAAWLENIELLMPDPVG